MLQECFSGNMSGSAWLQTPADQTDKDQHQSNRRDQQRGLQREETGEGNQRGDCQQQWPVARTWHMRAGMLLLNGARIDRLWRYLDRTRRDDLAHVRGEADT